MRNYYDSDKVPIIVTIGAGIFGAVIIIVAIFGLSCSKLTRTYSCDSYCDPGFSRSEFYVSDNGETMWCKCIKNDWEIKKVYPIVDNKLEAEKE